MVSLKHEGPAKLVRDRPAFAADLLGGLYGKVVIGGVSADLPRLS
jgi:hypothetical protein